MVANQRLLRIRMKAVFQFFIRRIFSFFPIYSLCSQKLLYSKSALVHLLTIRVICGQRTLYRFCATEYDGLLNRRIVAPVFTRYEYVQYTSLPTFPPISTPVYISNHQFLCIIDVTQPPTHRHVHSDTYIDLRIKMSTGTGTRAIKCCNLYYSDNLNKYILCSSKTAAMWISGYDTNIPSTK